MGYSARATIAKWLLCLAPTVTYFLNTLLASADLNSSVWGFPRWVPALNPPLGIDYSFNYHAGRALIEGGSPYSTPFIYPPFVPLIFKPLSYLAYPNAYVTQIVLLLAANVATMIMLVQIAWAILAGPRESRKEAYAVEPWLVSCSFLFLSMTSYPFMFSIERANYDIYPIFFTVCFLWILLEHPRWILLQTIFLSYAIHLKIYPAVLVVLMLWRHGWRCLPYLLAVNCAMLFVTGYDNARSFLTYMSSFANNPYMWVGNHSAASFASEVLVRLGIPLESGKAAASLLPLALWAIGAWSLLRRGYSDRGALMLFFVSFPIMSVLPSTSHDYKLIILYAPAAAFSMWLLTGFVRDNDWLHFLLAMVVLADMGFISRSYVVTSSIYLQNKYPFVIVLELAVVLAICASRHGRESVRAAAVAESGERDTRDGEKVAG